MVIAAGLTGPRSKGRDTDSDCWIAMWDTTGTPLRVIRVKEPSTIVRFSGDGSTIAVGSSTGVQVYATRTGELLDDFKAFSPQTLTLSADGRYLAIARGRESFHLIANNVRMIDRRERSNRSWFGPSVCVLKFLDHDRYMASEGGSIHIRTVDRLDIIGRFDPWPEYSNGFNDDLLACDESAQGLDSLSKPGLLVTARWRAGSLVPDVMTARISSSLRNAGLAQDVAAFSIVLAGNRIIVLDNQLDLEGERNVSEKQSRQGRGGTPQVFDVTTGMRVFMLPISASHVAASNDGRVIAGTNGERLFLWAARKYKIEAR